MCFPKGFRRQQVAAQKSTRGAGPLEATVRSR